jgi:signal transduction histidine kinase
MSNEINDRLSRLERDMQTVVEATKYLIAQLPGVAGGATSYEEDLHEKLSEIANRSSVGASHA